MMRNWLLVCCISFACTSFAQVSIPFDFTSEDENRLIKENDSLKYFVASTDTNDIVVLNEENAWYKLLNKEHKLIAEGAYITDGDKYLQIGKWVAQYENGKPKTTGYFQRNMPVGTWQEFYMSGKIKIISNYGIFNYKGEISTCLSGSWQEYYTNGKLKINGFYCGNIITYKDTISVEDPVTSTSSQKEITHREIRSEKTGHWEYFTETGELEKAVDF